ncbi:MAG: glycosyltransferase 87 family protein [Candidatus Velthaea sp.]
MWIALVLGFTAFRPPPTEGPWARDFEAYYAAGATVNAGGDPYSRRVWRVERTIRGVDASRDELLPFVGPAASLPLWSLLARLPHATALLVWLAVLGVAFVMLVVAALTIARAPRDPRLFAAACGFAFASGPSISSIALGQAALVSAAALALALACYRSRRAAGAVAATLLAALQPNLALTLLARMRSRWDVAVAATAALLFTILTVAAGGGIGGILAYAGRLTAHYGAERFIAIQHTPTAIAYALGAAPPAALAFGALVSACAVAVALATIARARLDPTSATLLTFTLFPFAVPFFHEHDFVLELVPAIVLAAVARGAARRVASIASVLVLVDWFGFAQRVAAEGQIVCLGVALACAFVAMTPAARGESRASIAGLATLVVLMAVLVPLAHAHAAPTWPDALPAHFRAPGTADASGVWGDEQRAAGLEARDAVWALLRALPLGGCALLAAATVLDARRRARERRLFGNAGFRRPYPMPRPAAPSTTTV